MGLHKTKSYALVAAGLILVAYETSGLVAMGIALVFLGYNAANIEDTKIIVNNKLSEDKEDR